MAGAVAFWIALSITPEYLAENPRNQVVTPSSFTPFDAVDLSRLHLRRIRGTANTALQRSGLDDETNAHLIETVARIDRALEAKRITGY